MNWNRISLLILTLGFAEVVTITNPTWSGRQASYRPLLLLAISGGFGLCCALCWQALSQPDTKSHSTASRWGKLRLAFLPAVAFSMGIMSALMGAAAIFAASFDPPPSIVSPAQRPRERTAVLLAINDVYRIEGLQGDKVGGLARVRTLRKRLEANAPGGVLLLHAGDVIFPSFLSRSFDGRQMIDVLNMLDGDPTPGRLDERMFVVFGNHEFDQESCDRQSPLADRVAESDFYWLHSNIVLVPCKNGRLQLHAANLVQGRIIDVNGIRIGLFGITIPDNSHPSFAFMDPLETAAIMTADLRRRGAEVVVALTHLSKETDLALHHALGSHGLDLIIGGHDHENMMLPGNTLEPRIFKADADAATAWVLKLRLDDNGRLHVNHELHALDQSVVPDMDVSRRVTAWLRQHEQIFCRDAGEDVACLSKELATTTTDLVASEESIRNAETSLGNWVADRMREAFKACDADAAIINAGGLRLNQDLPAKNRVTRRHIEELFQYPTELYLLELSAQQLQHALANGISQPGAGRWLQVSGLAFVYEPETRRITHLMVGPSNNRVATDAMKNPKQTFRVVVNRFLVENKDEGYVPILPPLNKAIQCGSTRELKQVVYDALKVQGFIAPEVEGRICKAIDTATRRCQAIVWSKGNTP